MQNNNNMPESIWADGCPENVQDSDKLTDKELHSMAIDYVAKYIISRGFKIENGYPRLQFPNIVCKKDGIMYAMIVVPSVFPDYLLPLDQLRINFVKEAKKRNCEPLYATISYKSIDEERANAKLTLKGDVFHTIFPGFHRLTEDKKQEFSIKPEDLFRP